MDQMAIRAKRDINGLLRPTRQLQRGIAENQPGMLSNGCCSTATARFAVKRLPAAGAPYKYAASAVNVNGAFARSTGCALDSSNFIRSGRNSSTRTANPCTASLLAGSVRNSTRQRPVGASDGIFCVNSRYPCSAGCNLVSRKVLPSGCFKRRNTGCGFTGLPSLSRNNADIRSVSPDGTNHVRTKQTHQTTGSHAQRPQTRSGPTPAD